MVMVLEETLVKEMARIGELRRPNEACGILLPEPVHGQQVVEVPNRATYPHDSFVMKGEDILLALEMVYREEVPDGIIVQLTAWHTHPGGNVGPSKADLQNKPPRIKSLVVTLFDDDRSPLASWF